MRALTAIPGRANSAAVIDVPEPPAGDGPVLVQTLAVGVCGTDREIVSGAYGWPPPGRERLVLGHESLGRVLEAPAGSGLKPGDLVAGIVRRPDPVPCPNCAAGEWDMCRNGRYTERGIKELDGYCSERFRLEPRYTVKVAAHLGHLGVLLEPASVLAKAWDHVERIGKRAVWQPRRVVVTGAGPIGLLAALMGVQRGLQVDVLDRVTDGPKPELVKALGATYHTGSVKELARGADIVIECTGVGQLVFDAMQHTSPGSIVCLTGISSGGRPLEVDMASLNKGMVLENDVVFGSVNANRRHYEAGADALAKADAGWLNRLVTRRVPLDRWAEALERRPGDVKTVIELGEQTTDSQA
ncbi:MAG: glucose 1-dehydrogenase [Gemmataceae bacterium]